MSQKVEKQDLKNFASVGFPADVRAAEHVSSTSLCQSIQRALANPSARLVQAAAMALAEVADRDDLDLFKTLPTMSGVVQRRLGFLAESVANQTEVSFTVRQRLNGLADRLRNDLHGEFYPVSLSGDVSRRQLDMLKTRASRLNEKWEVYGAVDFDRFHRLSSFQ